MSENFRLYDADRDLWQRARRMCRRLGLNITRETEALIRAWLALKEREHGAAPDTDDATTPQGIGDKLRQPPPDRGKGHVDE